MWDEIVEKAVDDTKAKANLQPPFYIKEIDSKCSKGYHLFIKKDKKDANWEHRNETLKQNKEKAKTYIPSSTNQPQA